MRTTVRKADLWLWPDSTETQHDADADAVADVPVVRTCRLCRDDFLYVFKPAPAGRGDGRPPNRREPTRALVPRWVGSPKCRRQRAPRRWGAIETYDPSPLAAMIFTVPAGVNPAARPIPVMGTLAIHAAAAELVTGRDRGSGLTPAGTAKDAARTAGTEFPARLRRSNCGKAATVAHAPTLESMKRLLTKAAQLFLLFAVIGQFVERMGAVECGCRADCWCKQPGLSLFRWVVPIGHGGGQNCG